MPNLFLVDGAAGSGKSALLRFCSESRHDSDFVVKYTTKPMDVDGVARKDLIYSRPEDYDRNKDNYFVYNYPSFSTSQYFISKKDIEDKLRVNKNVFLIIRSDKLIEKIRAYYSKFVNVNVVSIFVYSDNSILRKRAEKQLQRVLEPGESLSDEAAQEKIEQRLRRNEECLRSYIQSLASERRIYDHVILNDVSKDEYYTCINNIVDQYSSFDDKFDPPTAFIIMPMPQNRESAHFFNVKNEIVKAAESVGIKAQRQDDRTPNSETIYSNIRNSIKNDSIFIVDLTNTRPNCYFELGLAYGKGDAYTTHNTLILSEKGTPVEFDLAGIERHEYSYNPKNNDYSDLGNIVTRWLVNYIKEHVFVTEKMRSFINI